MLDTQVERSGNVKLSGKSIRKLRLRLNMTQPNFADWLSQITGEHIDSKMVCRMENFGAADACKPVAPPPVVVQVIHQYLEKERSNTEKPADPLKRGHMRRHYYVRGLRHEVEQIDGVMAVHLPPDSRAEIPSKLGTNDLSVSEEELEVFETAGWAFVDESTAYQRRSVLAEERQASGAVFRRPDDGAIMIGTKVLTVKLKPELTNERITDKLQQASLLIKRQLKFAHNLFEVCVPDEADPLDVANKLQQEDKDFIYAEPVMIEHIPQRQPTDPHYAQQWQWNNNGTNGAVANADVRAEIAWQHTRGKNVRVAVIDNGFDVDHEDLKAGIAKESGYFTPNEDFVQGLAHYPCNEHGTFCAGMIGARANNQCGGCGIAFECQLLLVSCLRDQVGTQNTLARAIAYAAMPSTEVDDPDSLLMGADVISCSLGPSQTGRWSMGVALEEAIEFSATEGREKRGIPIFWATSNANVPISDDQVCSHPRVIAVGRSNSHDQAGGSAYGAELDFLAPGVNVYSTLPQNHYGVRTGTSFATPCAAGVAALLINVSPDLSCEEVRQIMRETCDQVGGVDYENNHNSSYGFGRINATRAVNTILPSSGTSSLGIVSVCYVSFLMTCFAFVSVGGA